MEQLRGDRRRDLSVLDGRRWDVAIDTCGYVPSQVRASAQKLAKSVEHYTFISTVSVYSQCSESEIDENATVDRLQQPRLRELEALEPETPIVAEAYGDAYGALKALCERAAMEEMAGRVLNVRAGLLVGPYDYTDRFTYWPRRVARGGQVLAPGDPGRPRQFIDARDLAEWVLRAIEQNRHGTFNVTGPNYELTMGRVLDECRAAIQSDAMFTWVEDNFLIQAGVTPWTELPLWVPRSYERPGLMRVHCSRAVAAGLTFRPLADTILDTLAWDRRRHDGEGRRVLSQHREQNLLRAWHGRNQRIAMPANNSLEPTARRP
jgi:2'-hydroxyisoflavone reductase